LSFGYHIASLVSMKKMNAVHLKDLSFSFDSKKMGPPLLTVDSYSAALGTLNLLLGANGVGKSTLLRLIAGKHLVPNGGIQVLGRDPFSQPMGMADVCLVSGYFPLTMDLEVAELLAAAEKKPEYAGSGLKKELVDLLEVDPGWRMHRVSTGQRRRVDLLLALLADPKVLLLDEVTSDLDILCRIDLLEWLADRAAKDRKTIFLATHILDGLEKWADQLLFLGFGKVLYQGAIPKRDSLVRFAVKTMRKDIKAKKK